MASLPDPCVEAVSLIFASMAMFTLGSVMALWTTAGPLSTPAHSSLQLIIFLQRMNDSRVSWDKKRRNRSRSFNRNLLWTQVPIGKLEAEFYINTHIHASMGFPCGSVDKESTCNAETCIQSLGWEHPLEKGKATLSSILACRISWSV